MNRVEFAGRQYVRLTSLPESCRGLATMPHPFSAEFALLTTTLSQCLSAEPEPTNMFVVDFRTLAYPIVRILEGVTQDQLDQSYMSLTELAQLLWMFRFTKIPTEVSNAWRGSDPRVTRVICDDYPYQQEGFDRPIYWRHKVYREYKGGRPPKPKTWDIVTQAGYWSAEKLGLPVLREPLMEADDIIAALVRGRQDMPIDSLTIWTLDTDLLQLVTDEAPPVRWYNVLDYRRYRDHTAALEYWQARHKRAITHARQIVDDKVRWGDTSDNIRANNDLRGIIDLWGPQEKPQNDYRWAATSNYAQLSELTSAHNSIMGNLLLTGVSIRV